MATVESYLRAMRRAACLVAFVFALIFTSSVARADGFVYVLNDDPSGNTIYGYAYIAASYQFNPLPGLPLATGGNGIANTNANQRLAVDALRGRLYAVNAGSNTVSAYSINPVSGALTALPISPIALGTGNWFTISVHPSGSPLLVGDADGHAVQSFVVTATTATLAANSPFSTGSASPFSAAFSADGQYFYTGGNANGGNFIAGFSVDAAGGVLTALAGSPFDSGDSFPLAYCTDSTGRLYVSNGNSAELRVFTTASGIPTMVADSPWSSQLTQPVFSALGSDGTYYLADGSGSKIGIYTFTGSGSDTVLQTPQTPSTGGTSPVAIVIDPATNMPIVANAGSRNLTAYITSDYSQPQPQPVNTLGASGQIAGMAFIPQYESLLYVLNDNPTGNTIYGYVASEGSGAVFPIPGFPITTGGTGDTHSANQRLAIDRFHNRLFVVNAGSNTVSAYSIDASNGALSVLPYSGFSLGTGTWYSAAVDPTGSVLVVGDGTGNRMAAFKVTATTATAAAGSPFGTGGAAPYSIAFSKDGRYVYTGGNNNGGDFIASFSVNASTGVLTALAGSPYDSGDTYPSAYATDIYGRLFLGNYNGGELRAFESTDGVLSADAGNPLAMGPMNPVFGLLHPNNFYMVAERGGNSVGVYSISSGPTALNAVANSPFSTGGTSTNVLALSPSGTQLYAANSGSLNLSAFDVDYSAGTLGSARTQAANSLGSAGKISGMALAQAPASLQMNIRAPLTVVAGDGFFNLDITVTISNLGVLAVPNVQILNTLQLPAGVELVAESYSVGNFDPVTGYWLLPILGGGESTTLTLTYNVSASAPSNAQVKIISGLTGADAPSDIGSQQSYSQIVFGLLSGPTAMPSNPIALQPVNFAVSVGGSNETISWEFGDGTTGTGATPTHAYAVVGTYTASVVITGPGRGELGGSVQVDVGGPIVGTGADSDGDGFSDAFETFAMTDPNDINSTPTGAIITPASLLPLTLTKLQISLNFSRPGKDSISFAGKLAIPKDFVAAGKVILLDIGGVDARVSPRFRQGSNSFSIAIKSVQGHIPAQNAAFAGSLKNGTFAAAFANEGLTGDATIKKPVLKYVVFSMIFNNTVLQKAALLNYRAVQGKSGKAN